MIDSYKSDPIGSAQRGENPTFLRKMRTGVALFGYTQFLPGYCLLIATPQVESLNDLDLKSREEFLIDMSLLGDAILQTCHPIRVNYSLYGNNAAFLHAHVFPRYEWEPEFHRRNPVWTYPESNWADAKTQWDTGAYQTIMEDIAAKLDELMQGVY